MVILVPDGEDMAVESWIMSCRVLNRTVEEAVFSWVVNHAGSRSIRGEYISTEKNGLVKDLFSRLGFERVETNGPMGSEFWRYTPGVSKPVPRCFAEIRAV